MRRGGALVYIFGTFSRYIRLRRCRFGFFRATSAPGLFCLYGLFNALRLGGFTPPSAGLGCFSCWILFDWAFIIYWLIARAFVVYRLAASARPAFWFLGFSLVGGRRLHIAFIRNGNSPGPRRCRRGQWLGRFQRARQSRFRGSSILVDNCCFCIGI